jgi:SAM-dependent methyltransferase
MEDATERFRQFEHSGWECASGRYEACWSGLTRQFVGPLLQAVNAAQGNRLLDVACGPGYVAEAAHRLGCRETVGLDFSAEMVGHARSRLPDLEFREGDAQDLPFSAQSFDIVVMNFGVPHLSKPERAFAEGRRVLDAGGRFGFTVWALPEDNPGLCTMRDAVEAHADLGVDLPEGPPSQQFVDAELCRRVLADAGFAPASVRTDLVPVTWRVPTASFFFEAERDAGVRTAGLLAAQTPERLETIGAAATKAFKAFARADGEGYDIPMAAWIVTATTAP